MFQEPDKNTSFNFCVIASLVLDVGAEVLRRLLLNEVPPNILTHQIKQILTDPSHVRLKNIFNKDQMKLLQAPQPDPSKFDFCLIMIFLKNICHNIKPPANGWRHAPCSNDTSIGADIKRLIDIRNKRLLLHAPVALMSKGECVSLWKYTTEVILRIAISVSQNTFKVIKAKIGELQMMDFCPENKLRLTKLLEECCIEGLRQREENMDIAESLAILNSTKNMLRMASMLKCGMSDAQYDAIFPSAPLYVPVSCLEDHGEISSDKNCCVKLVKMYPWLKQEIEKKWAIEVACKLLRPDDMQSVRNSGHRRMTVDRLLKYVLKDDKDNYITEFWAHLKSYSEGKEELIEKLNEEPTEADIQDYKRLSEQQYGINPCQDPCKIIEGERDNLIFDIKDIALIDSLNNCFLSKFFFSLAEHDKICDFLHKTHYGDGASCLLDTMESCPMTIMSLFCDALELLGKKSIVDKYHLRNKDPGVEAVNQEENKTEMVEESLVSSIIRNSARCLTYVLDLKGFSLTSIDNGSILFYLNPDSQKSLEQLKEQCASGDVMDFLDIVLSDEKVFNLFATGGYRVSMSIYLEENHTKKDKAGTTVVLQFVLISDVESHLSGGPDQNSIDRNMNLFCEELDIDDVLIERLQNDELVQHSITEEIKQIKTRAGRIAYLLNQISSPEKGYKIIKEHQAITNTFLHEELEKRDQRKLLFQCEAQLDVKSTGVYRLFRSLKTRYSWRITNLKPVCSFDNEEKQGEAQQMGEAKHAVFKVEYPSTDTIARYNFLSMTMYQVMENIGASVENRDQMVRLQATYEEIQAKLQDTEFPVYTFGSQYEGTTTNHMQSDLDCVQIIKEPQLVTDMSNLPNGDSLLLVQDKTTPVGYAKLQVVKDKVPRLDKEDIMLNQYVDNENRVLISSKQLESPQATECIEPPLTYWGHHSLLNKVHGYKCRTWPDCATEWLSRKRSYNWPPHNLIEMCKALGFIVMPKAHPYSNEKHLLWGISLCLQERLLVAHFDSVQLKCFILLKLIGSEMLPKLMNNEILTSYHFKTCMFYLIENTPKEFWRKENVVACLITSLKVILQWTENSYWPNYFIPAENMFEGKTNGRMKEKLSQALKELLSTDIELLLQQLQSENIGEAMTQVNCTDIESDLVTQDVNSEHMNHLRMALPVMLLICEARNAILLDQYDDTVQVFYEKLSEKMGKLEGTVNEQSDEVKQAAVELICQSLRPSLVSNFVATEKEKKKTEKALLKLLTCAGWANKHFDTLKLKEASIRSMLKDYQNSMNIVLPLRWRDRLSICGCKSSQTVVPKPEDILRVADWTSTVTVQQALRQVLTPCVVFLPTEKDVTPVALNYEMIRSFGMTAGSRNERTDYWYDWAVVDGQFLAPFLLVDSHASRHKCSDVHADGMKMKKLIKTGKVSHTETCLNLLGWFHYAYGDDKSAVECFGESLKIQPIHNAAFWHLLFLICSRMETV